MKSIIKLMKISGVVIAIVCLLPLSGCKKFLDAPVPVNTITSSTAFATDATVSGVIAGNFFSIGLGSGGILGSNSVNSLGATTGLYTDELQNISIDNTLAAFYANVLSSANNNNHWVRLNKMLYNVNLALEGINANAAKLTYKNQWLGETLFNRAVLYYYYVNLYGDVPLLLTSDLQVNSVIARSPKARVYQQIIADLKQAQSLLSADYKDGTGTTATTRFRPNQATATALLARIYLYTGDWVNAEAQATAVINNTAYGLVTPGQVFLAGNKETIWAMATPSGAVMTDYMMYNRGMPAVIPSGSTPSTTFQVNLALSPFLVNAFEGGDLRFSNWVRQVTVGGATTYYFPNKYKSPALGEENIVILRLAEQYLIRSEARARQNNINGSQADLNAIRARAGLSGTTAATSSGLVTAIIKERYVELFTEHGQRFFDLKRTGTIDAVMGIVAPQKKTTWDSFRQYWPIAPTDVLQNPNLTQTPGYL